MSKARTYAAATRRLKLNVPQVGSPYAELFFVDDDGRLRIGNAGPFTPRDARRIAAWIETVFGRTGEGR
jgi:hypothetical protein